jgi:hypothetical protein
VVRGEIPLTYTVTILSVYLALAVLNSLFGSESIAGENLYSSDDWLELTPVPAATFVIGKIGFFVIHSLLLVLIALPFLILAAAPSGMEPAAIAITAGIIFLYTSAYRAMAFALLLCLKEHPFLLHIALWALMFVVIVASAMICPRANPIYLLQSLQVWSEAGVGDAAVEDIRIKLVTGGCVHLTILSFSVIIISLRAYRIKKRQSRE